MSISFRKYHNDHHIYLGIEGKPRSPGAPPLASPPSLHPSLLALPRSLPGKDPDLPTRFEVKLLSNPIAKAIWAFFQVAFYVLRPAITMPRVPCRMELVNWGIVVAFDSFLALNWGWRPLAYLLLSSILGSGYHPAAGHFIAEHYVLGEPDGKSPQDPSTGQAQETFSYYGPLNSIMFNGGYHMEHHDHPAIPCWRLPELHKIAPEFYQGLKSYK